jgi:hypothetical protein
MAASEVRQGTGTRGSNFYGVKREEGFVVVVICVVTLCKKLLHVKMSVCLGIQPRRYMRGAEVKLHTSDKVTS